jgi:hypothetical protein
MGDVFRSLRFGSQQRCRPSSLAEDGIVTCTFGCGFLAIKTRFFSFIRPVFLLTLVSFLPFFCAPALVCIFFFFIHLTSHHRIDCTLRPYRNYHPVTTSSPAYPGGQRKLKRNKSIFSVSTMNSSIGIFSWTLVRSISVN